MTDFEKPAAEGGHNDLASLFTNPAHRAAVLILLGALVALIGAFAIFGYSGLIVVTLAAVAVAWAIILLLSRM